MTDGLRLPRGESDSHRTGNDGADPFRGPGIAAGAFDLDHLDHEMDLARRAVHQTILGTVQDAQAELKRLGAAARDRIAGVVAFHIRSLRRKRRYERALKLNGEVTWTHCGR